MTNELSESDAGAKMDDIGDGDNQTAEYQFEMLVHCKECEEDGGNACGGRGAPSNRDTMEDKDGYDVAKAAKDIALVAKEGVN